VPLDNLDLVLNDRPVRGTVTQQRFPVPRCKSTEYQKYAPRTILEWNSLPDAITSAVSVSSFIRQLTALVKSLYNVHSAHPPHRRDIRWSLAIIIQIQT